MVLFVLSTLNQPTPVLGLWTKSIMFDWGVQCHVCGGVDLMHNVNPSGFQRATITSYF